MDHHILIEYLIEYKSQPRAFKGTLAFPQFIQLEEERRPCSTRKMKGNRFLLSTFDGSSSAKDWARRLEELFLLHPVVDKEAVDIIALHMKGKASTWWFSHISHARVSTLVGFNQKVIKRFDEEKSERDEPSPPLEDIFISAVTTLEEQPSTSVVEGANIVEERNISAMEGVPKA